MKIKRYTAASMRAALALVRAEQGPDAVILSSRRGEDGIEVIAAVDYDEALLVEARQRSPAASPEPPAPTPSQKLIPSSFRRLTVSSLPGAPLPQVSAPATVSVPRTKDVGGGAA